AWAHFGEGALGGSAMRADERGEVWDDVEVGLTWKQKKRARTISVRARKFRWRTRMSAIE
ncbi:MAG: hypothetical protein ACXWJB_03575, partial [Limisphaerales bacterium]